MTIIVRAPAVCIESYFSAFRVQGKKKLCSWVFHQVQAVRLLTIYFGKFNLEFTFPDFPGPLSNLEHPKISYTRRGRVSTVGPQVR